jgi:hypothetical protein
MNTFNKVNESNRGKLITCERERTPRYIKKNQNFQQGQKIERWKRVREHTEDETRESCGGKNRSGIRKGVNVRLAF